MVCVLDEKREENICHGILLLNAMLFPSRGGRGIFSSHLLFIDGNRNCVNAANRNALLLQHFTI